ncbi:amino acid adenylation domain-containing protein [Thermoactinomyces sp. CICC 24226]|uniref:amino acid adenylation domain-containing protein n=1 Tax=Thermoactinomyces sp. CICC 24226 TaxID=2767431 RepID=UPI00351C1BE0
MDYKFYINWRLIMTKANVKERWSEHRKYYDEWLSGYDGGVFIPARKTWAGKENMGDKTEATEHYEIRLSRSVTESFYALSRRYQGALSSLLQGVWGSLLLRYSGEKEVLFAFADHSGKKVSACDPEIRLLRVKDDFQTFHQLFQHLSETNVHSDFYLFPLSKFHEATGMEEKALDHLVVVADRSYSKHDFEYQKWIKKYKSHVYEIKKHSPWLGLIVTFIPAKYLTIRISYDPNRYDGGLVQATGHHLKQIIESVTSQPRLEISKLQIVTAQEKKLLKKFNETTRAFPDGQTVHWLIEQRVMKSPNRTAVEFKGVSLTYQELNRRADLLAMALRDHGIEKGDIVAIMVPPSLEMIVGVLGILKTGAAYLPVDPNYPPERVSYMLSDSHAKMLLSLKTASGDLAADVPVFDLAGMDWSVTREVRPLPSTVRPDDLAYVIYTSGSTGKPKGVMIEHSSLVNLVYWHNQQFHITEKDRCTKYAGFGFDASVWEIFPPLVAGATLYVIEEELRYDIRQLNDFMQEKGVTVSFLPTQVAEQFMELKNHCLKTLLVGGDRLQKVVPQTYQIVNNYGPTENTVVTTSGTVRHGEPVMIGKPIANHRVYVLDQNHELQPIGVPGELCISGAGLARGYLNRDDLTWEKFVPNPHEPGEIMYKTGDLVRWLPDGRLEFLGRLDDQVKIRGFRIELGEITQRLMEYPLIQDALVLVQKDEYGENRLVGYFTAREGWEEEDIRKHLAQELPDFMIPSHLIHLEAFPLTPNGKVDKTALPLPEAEVAATREMVKTTDETEQTLIRLWREILHVEPGTGDHFFHLGGDSLKLMRLVSRIREEFQIQLSIQALFENPVLREMAVQIRKAEGRIPDEWEGAEEKEYYPVSSVQKRLYAVEQMENIGTTYHTPVLLEWKGNVDTKRLKSAVEQLVQRHEALRTSFHWVDEELVQKVHAEAEITWEMFHADSEEEVKRIAADFIRPFDLGQAPLLRAALIHAKESCYLLLDMHHIVSDGISVEEILYRELGALYQGQELPPLSKQYKDYALWQQQWLGSEECLRRKEYWLKQLEGEIPVLELPADYPRSPVQEFAGDKVSFEVKPALVERLKQIGQRENATLFMMLFSAYKVLISKLSGQEDIIVGIPVAGRAKSWMEPVFGMFVNTLPLRSQPKKELSFAGYMQQVRTRVLGAYENGDYPLEEIIGALQLERDRSRNPLFDTAFVLQNMEEAAVRIPGADVKSVPLPWKQSMFDMTWEAKEEADTVRFHVEYCTRLFERKTIQRYIRSFLYILEQIAKDPGQCLADVELLPPEDRHQLVTEFNRTDAPYPGTKTIQQLFEEQVLKTPDRPAVKMGDQVLTYQALNAEANRMARWLRKQGVTRGSVVGLMVNRSPLMMVSLLAIVKAGGTYLPIDPEYPDERIRFMLEDSQASMLLVEPGISAPVSYQGTVAGLSPDVWKDEDPGNLPNINAPEDVLYIIYTSGSTGTPKGIETMHYNVIRTMFNNGYIEMDPSDRVLQLSNYAFDGSTFDIYISLLHGAQLTLVSTEALLDLNQLSRLIREEQITVTFITTALFNTLVDLDLECLRNVRKILFGGEKVSFSHVKRAVEFLGEDRVVHVYGPTETTVFATYCPVGFKHIERGIIPIGKPLHNTRLYVLNSENQLQPVGVPGELCISGDGVAKGYLNRPELTEERFVREPFAPYGRMYKTGDLVRWLPDGTIEYLDRLDDQVKIRGHRIELGEIQRKLLEEEAVREAFVMMDRDEKGQSYLCAYCVAEGEIDVSKLRQNLQKKLPDYMVPGYFVQMDSLPLNANGKVDKRALPKPDLRKAVSAGYVEPSTETEALLAEVWKEVLGAERVGIHDNFFELGGDSIKAIRIAARLNQQQMKLETKQLFRHPTIAELAPSIRRGVSRMEEEEVVSGDVRLTPIQKWFFSLQSEEPHHFNQAMMLFSGEGWNPAWVGQAFQGLVRHHDALRMTYDFTNGEIKQTNQPLEHQAFTLDVFDLTGSEPANIEAYANKLQKGIDLKNGPLVRLGVFHTREGDYLLMVIHHLVVDGVSWRILLEDFQTAYDLASKHEEIRLPQKTSSFKTWAKQLFQFANSKKMLKEKSYWKRVCSQTVPALPKDEEWTGEKLHRDMREIELELDEELTRKLLTQAHQAYHTEMNDLLLTGLALAVHEWTGQSKVALHLEGHGREELFDGVDLNRTVGWFTTMYPVVFELNETELSRVIPSVKETLRHVPEKGIGYGILRYLTSLDHKQDLSFALEPEISFNYLGQFEKEGLGFGSISTGDWFSPLTPEPHVLTFNSMVADGKFKVRVGYNHRFFRRETIETVGRRFLEHLTRCVRHCLKQAEPVRTPSDFSARDLSIRELEQICSVLDPKNIHDIYPLSSLQKGILFHAIQTRIQYFEQFYIDLDGEVDFAAFEKSLDDLVQKHDVLRTVFLYQKLNQPFQTVLKEVEVPFRFVDLSHQSKEEQEAFLTRFKREDRKKGFATLHEPLIRFALFKLGDRRYHFVWSFHHILFDGWCIGLLLEDWLDMYRARMKHATLKVEKMAPYRDYIRWLEEQDHEEAKAFWRDYLHGYEQTASVLSKGIGRKTDFELEKKEVSFRLPRHLSDRLSMLAQKYHVTPSTFFQAIWGVLLQKYNNTDDVVFGTVVSGRPSDLPQVEKMVGLFINTVPVRIRRQENEPFSELLVRTQREILEAEKAHYASLAEIQANTPLFNQLFDHIMAFENYPLDMEALKSKEKDLGFSIAGLDAFEQDSYGLGLIIYPGDEWLIKLKYDTEVYTESDMQHVILHLQTLMEQIMENPETPLDRLEIVSEKEKQQLLVDFNRTKTDYPKQAVIQQLFEQQVNKTPDHPALVYKEEVWTYKKLNEQANQLARNLRNKGIGREQIVGIMMNRSPELIVSILAVLKAGGAYLPVDPDYPAGRIQYMLEDSQAKLLLVQPGLQVPAGYRGNVLVISPSLMRGDASDLPVINQPGDLAYMIYTSGSTGKPKGVMIEHRNLCNLVQIAQPYEIREHSRVLQFASISFDASVAEIFPTLTVGATLYLEEKMVLLNDLVKYLKEKRISNVTLPPSVLQSVPHEELPDLETIISAGEACSPGVAGKWGAGRTFINAYGPTEATVCTTYAKLDDSSDKTPIGKPFFNQQVYIVNKDHQLQPVGVPGELCISGEGLARGYWNRPELTAEKFVENPFVPGTKMYKTGDMARWLADGNIEYLGRFDEQVKIRGHRVELGEITDRLLKHPSVEKAAVVAQTNENGTSYLCAYFTAKDSWSVPELRRYMMEELPEYMVPAFFVELEQLPLTPNGKIDKKALPKPDGMVQTGKKHTSPTNEAEKKLVQIWKEVLGLERIGIHDDFFELGGDSIKAIQIVSRLHQWDYKLKINDLFDHPTIYELAPYVQTVESADDEGIVEGEVPLTPIQHWFFEQEFMNAHHWNQSMMLYHPDGWQKDRVHQAFSKLVEHHDALRMRFEQDGEKWVQINRGLAEGESFNLYEFDLRHVNDPESHIKSMANELQRNHDFNQGKLIQLGLFKTCQGDHLLIILHHLLVDGVSWRILLEDFATAYQQVSANQEVVLPKKTTSFKKWSKKLTDYADSPQALSELNYWKQVENTDVPALPRDFTLPTERRLMDHATIKVELTEEETKQLLTEVHHAYHTEINDLLLTALVLAVRKWTGQERVAVNLEGHGREEIVQDVDLSRTIGWFTTAFPVVFDLDTDHEGDAIKQVKEQLRKIPNKGIGYGILKYLTSPVKKEGMTWNLKPEISFNYLGQFDQENEDQGFQISPMPTGDEFSPLSTSPYLLNIYGKVMDQRLEMNFQYHQHVYRFETVARLAEEFVRQLRRLIGHCVSKEEEWTPSDFSSKDLTFEELEDISDLLSDL